MGSVRTTFRQARADDMRPCALVFQRSSRDLARRLGNAPPRISVKDIATALAHLQRTDPRGFQVAVRGGRVVAFASTILRGRTHFLSMFWTLPGLQGKGIGRRVLTRAFEEPGPKPTAIRCVFASLDTRAQVLYMKYGMRPRGLFYMVRGKPNAIPRPPRQVDLVPLGKNGRVSRAMLATAARFDRRFRGSTRDADIRFVAGQPGARFHLARAGGRTIGYAVITDKGRVGPAGVTDTRYGAGFAWAIVETVRGTGAESMFAMVPGVNGSALETFLRAGLKVEFFGAWMSARPVGAFETYLLAGGMLL